MSTRKARYDHFEARYVWAIEGLNYTQSSTFATVKIGFFCWFILLIVLNVGLFASYQYFMLLLIKIEVFDPLCPYIGLPYFSQLILKESNQVLS